MPAPITKHLSELSPDVIAYTNGPMLLAQTGSFFALALMTVLFRSYSRWFIVKSFGKEDWIMLLAMACATACFTSYAYQISLGVGKYIAVIHDDQKAYQQIVTARQFHMVAVVMGLSLAKISVAFFLMRLTVRKLHTYFLWGLIILLTCFTTVYTCTLCMPIRATWDIQLRPPPIVNGHARCFSEEVFAQIALFNGNENPKIVNITTDILLALLPVPLIWILRIKIRSRIALTIVLGLGVFAAIAGITRQASLVTTRDPEPWVHDEYTVWNFIKLDVSIIAASLPATKPLLNRIYRSLTRSSKMSNFSSRNIAVYIRQPHLSDIDSFGVNPLTVPLSAGSGKFVEHDLTCASKESGSVKNGNNPRSYSPGKGEILVTQHIEITTS